MSAHRFPRSHWPLPSLLAQALSGLRHSYQNFNYRYSVARALRSLDDRVLKDIGIPRGEIEAIVAGLAHDSGRFATTQGPTISSKSPSSLQGSFKQANPVSTITGEQGECC